LVGDAMKDPFMSLNDMKGSFRTSPTAFFAQPIDGPRPAWSSASATTRPNWAADDVEASF